MSSRAQRDRGWILPTEITGHPTVCIQFQIPDDPTYIAAVKGAINELTKWWNWEKDGTLRASQAATIFRTLIHETLTIDEVCAGAPDDTGCLEYKLNDSLFEWQPNDPFRTPGLTPAGYAFPPWYIANALQSVLLGTEPGDVVTDILRFQSVPVVPPASGYPRLRINVKGAGLVRMYFVKVNAGGYVQITTDDDILSVEFVSLNLDTIAIPPESPGQLIVEREVEGDGEHHIDLIFIPRVNDELPFVNAGGAIRKIVLCGFDAMQPECPDCDACEDCPDPDDIIDDWTDDLGIDRDDLEDNVNCIFPAIGDIKGSLGNPGRGWLLCDGESYSKSQYPELAELLAGLTPADDESFNVPDLSGRLLMGSSTALQLLPGGLDGSLDVTLTPDNLPAHSHTVPAHSHTTQPHSHTSPPHNHNTLAHTHSIAPHNHPVIDPGHGHTIVVRQNLSNFGDQLIAVGANATANGTRSTVSATTGITVDNAPPLPTNATQSINLENSVVINNADVTVNSAPAADTGQTGGGEPVLVIPPVMGVLWYIFGGCKEVC